MSNARTYVIQTKSRENNREQRGTKYGKTNANKGIRSLLLIIRWVFETRHSKSFMVFKKNKFSTTTRSLQVWSNYIAFFYYSLDRSWRRVLYGNRPAEFIRVMWYFPVYLHVVYIIHTNMCLLCIYTYIYVCITIIYTHWVMVYNYYFT